MATYDAGIVTAYGAAVRGGYTGTYEEFCAQQANYAQSAAAVEQAKEDVQELVDSIPADYTQLSDDVSGLKEDFDDLDDRVTAIEGGGSGSGLTEDIKAAMLQIASKVAYIDEHGQDYYDALYDALYPPADLVSISAVYNQSGAVYDTDTLDSLKGDLVVTAHMSDSTTRTVTAYTLSGTLTEGISTITVSYGGKTTTFTVTVSHVDNSIINWDFRQSLTDSKQGLVATLGGSATQDENGLHITGANGFAKLGKILGDNRIYEFDVADMDISSWTSGHGRFFIWYSSNGSGLIYRSTGLWTMYTGSWHTPSVAYSDKNYFANSQIRVRSTSAAENYLCTVYKDGVELFGFETNYDTASHNNDAYIGGAGSNAAFSMTITGMRVYEVE